MASRVLLAGLCAVMAGWCYLAIAQEKKESANAAAPKQSQQAAVMADGAIPAAAGATTHGRETVRILDESAMRIEGEKRFRTNCGRCHMAPHKFPPRTMAMIIRHMRVRAMITDEDMRLILHYMTQ